MHKKFEINQIKIKGGCQSGREAVTHNSKSDLPLAKSSLCTPTRTEKVYLDNKCDPINLVEELCRIQK